MRLIRFADLEPVPWKNGGGVTVEIAIDPPGAALDAFDWRVSAAEIRHSGAFSRFEGIDRTLAVLDGEGLLLDFGGRIERVKPADPPIAFPGEVAVTGTPLGGFVRDLNVMTRRSAWRADVSRRRLTRRASLEGEALIVALDASRFACGAERFALAPRDALALEGGEIAVLDQTRPSDVIVIAFHRAGQN